MQCATSDERGATGITMLLRAVAAIVVILAGGASASASDPSVYVSEILTPAGWELYGVWCGDQDEPASSSELRTPDGWGNASSREEPRWGGYGCSEVVVPPDWNRFTTP
jgi:hypothetical protein